MAKENKNKSFVLRIDVKMMEAIEKWAEDEFRSVNGQILYLLEQALKKNGRIPAKKTQRTQNNPEND
jgi:hypothetical protein